jgi:hypothetical protein
MASSSNWCLARGAKRQPRSMGSPWLSLQPVSNLDGVIPGLSEAVGRIYDHQQEHPGEPERFCMGKNHCAFKEHCEPPCLHKTKPTFPGPGIGQGGRRTDKARRHQSPEPRIFLGLHVGNDITGDREETCAEGHDQSVLVFSVEIEFFRPYNFGHEPGIHLDAGFNCLLITARSEIAALVGYFYCFCSVTITML